MKPLPLPLRVAAGLAVTAVDRARHLPEKLAELPVTVVSQALQLSMRVRQQVTELAIKGDDALSTLRPVEETPEWATFDEDKLGESYDASPTWSTGSEPNGSRSRFDSVRLTPVEVDELSDEPNLDADPARSELSAHAAAGTEGDGEVPVALPNYPELSLPQVRARLRKLNIAELDELLGFERAHDNRPEFVGMLTRRMSTLRDQR